jgi:hypothetical protein
MRLTKVDESRLAGGLTSLAALLTFLALVIGYHLPPDTGELGVVFPPWFDEPSAVSAIISAGGTLAGGTRFPNILIAVAPDPGFSNRVAEYGALLTTSARGLCAPLEGLKA